MMKLGTVTTYLKKIKLYELHDTPLELSWHQHFLPEISRFCYIRKYRYRLHFKFIFNFFWAFLINRVTILMMSAKLTTLGLSKIEVIWYKSYDAITFFHDVTNKMLLYDSSYIVNVVRWPKFGNSTISMREVIITSIL